MKEIKISLISLGCEKNLVDSEMILGMLKDTKGSSGYLFKIVDSAYDSDIIIINTCGFIESAKKEALDVIFDAVMIKEEKKGVKIVVCGCLAERYLEELKKEITEVDLFIPLKDSVYDLRDNSPHARRVLTYPFVKTRSREAIYVNPTGRLSNVTTPCMVSRGLPD